MSDMKFGGNCLNFLAILNNYLICLLENMTISRSIVLNVAVGFSLVSHSTIVSPALVQYNRSETESCGRFEEWKSQLSSKSGTTICEEKDYGIY